MQAGFGLNAHHAGGCTSTKHPPTRERAHARTQVTVAILLNSFVGAINSAEEEETKAAMHSMKSKELLR